MSPRFAGEHCWPFGQQLLQLLASGVRQPLRHPLESDVCSTCVGWRLLARAAVCLLPPATWTASCLRHSIGAGPHKQTNHKAYGDDLQYICFPNKRSFRGPGGVGRGLENVWRPKPVYGNWPRCLPRCLPMEHVAHRIVH